MSEQRSLFRWRQIMQDVEERDVSGKIRDRFFDVVKAKLDVAVMAGRDLRAVTNLSPVDIQAEDWLPARALPQIKSQQSHAAAHVEDRLGGRSQEFVSRLINSVAAQFAAHVVAQPSPAKQGGDPPTRTFVVRRVSSQGFHLRRIIALPDGIYGQFLLRLSGRGFFR